MTDTEFVTPDGRVVPAVTAAQMRAVDRVAVEEFHFGVFGMMENAGRTLAHHARRFDGPVTVLAGAGGNGGGGLACARHLTNRSVPVEVVLDRDPGEIAGPAGRQARTLDAMGVPMAVGPDALADPGLVVDALVGYGLSGPLGGTAAELVEAIDPGADVLSLDVPSGVDATTGQRPGPAVDPDRTLTLALPKTGLTDCGDLVLADIAIPAGVYAALDIDYESPFDDDYWVEVEAV